MVINSVILFIQKQRANSGARRRDNIHGVKNAIGTTAKVAMNAVSHSLRRMWFWLMPSSARRSKTHLCNKNMMHL